MKATLLPLAVWDGVLTLASATYPGFRTLFRWFTPGGLDRLGRRRALRAQSRALRAVPALAGFAGRTTDKKTYIDAFTPDQRSVGGRLPDRNVSVDESSGSTGTPYHWTRGHRERRETHRFIRYFTRHVYGRRPAFVLNAFSMGAWATGVNMGQALEGWGTVKNTGPDLAKLCQTLRYFGPDRDYLVLGYPPFLKQFVDRAADHGIDLSRYHLRALVGGEGMTEALRDYLETRFAVVYSGYGATDLEIGMAGETPAAVGLRRACRHNEALRRDLFGPDGRLPMVFQYNPLTHWAEVTADGELVFTISRGSLLCPRIRYNIHDEGGVLRWDEAEAVLRTHGLTWADLGAGRDDLRLPFVFVYGRSDATVSVMGANLYPEDTEEAVYRHPDLARVTLSFCQGLAEGEGGVVRPRFAFCVADPAVANLAGAFRDALVETLLALNADFRAGWAESPADLEPVIELWGPGQGPFAGDAGKIKQTRLLR